MNIQWITTSGFLFTATENVVTSTTLLASGDDISFKLLSGNLPKGLTLDNSGTISGIPDTVLNVQRNKFVVRAYNTSSIADRSFIIDVDGPDDITWNTYTITTGTTTGTLTTSTSEGYLSLGLNGEPYVFNNQWVDFQLLAENLNSPSGTPVKYFIGNRDGKLPPGLILEENGRIRGFVKDKLTFDGDSSPTGGYDDESFDGYSYDHATGISSVIPITSVPKIYQFNITATNGVKSFKRLFKILVVNSDMFRADSALFPLNIDILNLDILKTSISYVQKPQFLQDSNLGTIRANNNVYLDVSAYDSLPFIGSLTYYISTSTDVLNNLPQGLSLEPNAGYIYGFIPYQPAYTKKYTLTVNAEKTDNQTKNIVTATNTFTLAVKGEVESAIEWSSNSLLGNIQTGQQSELNVSAVQIQHNYPLKYKLISGDLPPGLNLEVDGSISGKVDYLTSGTFTFVAQAIDIYELSAIEKEFSISVFDNGKRYTNIYVKPFLSTDKRNYYKNFVSDTSIFDPKLLYRFYDSMFGLQNEIKFYLEYGIEQTTLGNYTIALRENFYDRNFYFGEVKKAIALDSSNKVIYEIIYVEIIDELNNLNNISVSKVIYKNDNIYYPASADNMREQLKLLVIDDERYIEINESFKPRFMKSIQPNQLQELGYIRFVPICYALPGQGDKIISRIKNSNFNFNNLNFKIDRIIVEDSLDYSSDKYLLFERKSITDDIVEDQYLFGPEGNVRLDTEDNQPIIRE